jgi:aminoglycoside 6'-N-acetyltransferase I
MPIIDLSPDNPQLIAAAALVLLRGFRGVSPAWPTLESALDEVRECTAPGGIARAYIDEEGRVLGWIAGNSQYDGHVWELHPLVVDPEHQGRGVGRALVADFETHAAARGAITILLGTDDETDRTSLSGAEVYPQVWRAIAGLENKARHPFEFYQKQGYVVVGIVPDANGYGKPDILMAKRVAN